MDIRPPGVQPKWEDNGVLVIEDLLSYGMIRSYEEAEELHYGANLQGQHP